MPELTAGTRATQNPYLPPKVEGGCVLIVNEMLPQAESHRLVVKATSTGGSCGPLQGYVGTQSMKLLMDKRPVEGFGSGTKLVSMQPECNELRR